MAVVCTPLTPEQRKKLLEAFKAGVVYLDIAGMFAGVPDTVRLERALQEAALWRQRERDGEAEQPAGEKPEAWLLALAADIEESKGHAFVAAIGSIMAQGKKDARYLQWWLAHVQPARWAEISKMELTGKDGGPVEFSLADVLKAVDAKRTGTPSD